MKDLEYLNGAETETHSSEVVLVISDFRFEVNTKISDSISPSDNCVTAPHPVEKNRKLV